MSGPRQNEPDNGGDDLIAAEYVLGVLPAHERQDAARRIDTDPGFARLVDEWEVRLSPLASAYPQVQPHDTVKAAIDRRLFAAGQATVEVGRTGNGLWTSLAFWRGLAAAVAALVIAVALPLAERPAPRPDVQLVASLAAQDSDVKYLALYDPAHHEVGLSHVAGDRAQGKDFELWMIEGKNAPVSMGVVPVGSTVRIELSPAVQQKLAQGAVLAISLEQKGGSPTGKPTGPVVAWGDLKSI